MRDLLKQLIFEALGATFSEAQAEAEAEAQKRFVEAETALKEWDENEINRIKWVDYLKLHKISMTGEKARKLKSQFNYVYTGKKRESLITDLDAARENYALYNPEIAGFKRKKKDTKTTSQAPAVSPSKDKPVYVAIEELMPLIWYSWKDSRWADAIKDVPYGSTTSGDMIESLGTGPGEERLAVILGGAVQGSSTSFDIVVQNGSKWEVKGLEASSALIRPGTKGNLEFSLAKKKLIKLISELEAASEIIKKENLLEGLPLQDAAMVEYVIDFLDTEISNIERGEISVSRFREIFNVIKTAKKIKDKYMVSSEDDHEIALGDVKRKVRRDVFINVAKQLERETGESIYEAPTKHLEFALSMLKDPAFDDPKKFIDDFFASIDVTRIFSGVDGMFIVNAQQGFSMIPAAIFTDALKFESISQGVPKFSYVYF